MADADVGGFLREVRSDGLGALVVGGDPLNNRFGGGHTPLTAHAAASGDNVLLTPPAGYAIALFWLGLSSPESNTAETLAIVRIGATALYRWWMGAPGAFSHWEPYRGAPDEQLVINLSAAQPVEVSGTYAVIAP